MREAEFSGERSSDGGMDDVLSEATIWIVSSRPEGAELVARLGDSPVSVRSWEALEALDDCVERRQPDIIAIDEEMIDSGDRESVSWEKNNGKPITILLVADCTAKTVSRVIDLGLSTYLYRDVSPREFLRVVTRELRATDNGQSTPEAFEVPRMVGSSDEMRNICRKVAAISPTDATILLTGESGTGKELIARWIHRFSPRRDGPFVPINCGAIPDQLVESKLFGHVKGAFTGATNDRPGQFEVADGGTLFLDEVGELAPDVQVKLLRVLQRCRFERVGATTTIETDVRLIAATNVDLSRAVKEGHFRSDLYYRLNVFHLELPPLREREGDILQLWRHFVRSFDDAATDSGIGTDPRVLQLLLAHDWPGNVRELENAARHAVTMRDEVITPGGLPAQLRQISTGDDASTDNCGAAGEEWIQVLGMSLDELERIAILRTVEHTETIAEAARILGIAERTLYYRLDEYRDDDDESDQ